MTVSMSGVSEAASETGSAAGQVLTQAEIFLLALSEFPQPPHLR
jgi:hypothetical protein